MAPEFPYRGTYAVKSFLTADLYSGKTFLGDIYGWALSEPDSDKLNEVVICDYLKPNDETKWIAVAMQTTGDLAMMARALWLEAQTETVKHDLIHKYDELEFSRRQYARAQHREWVLSV